MTKKELQEKARQERNRYAREWRKAHPDKVRATQERYWLKRATEQEDDGDGRGED